MHCWLGRLWSLPALVGGQPPSCRSKNTEKTASGQPPQPLAESTPLDPPREQGLKEPSQALAPRGNGRDEAGVPSYPTRHK